jgi:hypothetical protein
VQALIDPVGVTDAGAGFFADALYLAVAAGEFGIKHDFLEPQRVLLSIPAQ